MDLTYKNKLTKLAEETQRKQEEESRKYNYIDQAMFKIKDRDYISPYDRVGLNDYSAKTQEEINTVSLRVNNYPRDLLNWKSPFDVATVLFDKKILDLNELTKLVIEDFKK